MMHHARTYALLGALLLLAPAARGATERPFFVGADAGVAIPFTELETTFHVEVEFAYRFLLDGRLGAGIGFGYSRPTTSGQVAYADTIAADGQTTAREASYETTLDQMVLSVPLFFRLFDDETWWTPWVAAGPAVFFLSHEVRAFEATNTETGTVFGLVGAVGVDFQLGPGAITAKARFPWAPVDNRTLGDVIAGVGAATIQVGYRFFF